MDYKGLLSYVYDHASEESKSFISRVSHKHGKGDSANKINTVSSSAHVDNSAAHANETEHTIHQEHHH